MAKVITSNSFPKDFNFISNPVIVEATNETNVSGSSMHQTVVEVISPLPSSIGESVVAAYTFECEATPGGTVSVDISSALRALIDPKEWTPIVWADGDSISYPSQEFAVRVYDRYLIDGIIERGADSYYPSDANLGAGHGARAYLGGLSELERYALSNHPVDFYQKLEFTHKPLTAERWGKGDLRLTSEYSSGVKTTVHHIADSEATLPSGHHHFLFVNSMGVYETVSAVMRESLSYGMESSVHSLVKSPLYQGATSLSTYKNTPRASFQMSSGYTTREWADWWATEFLAAKFYWIKMKLGNKLLQSGNTLGWTSSALWVPCTITPAEDETLIYDRSEQQLLHVDFEVNLSISGSITTSPSLRT